jgi:hypothetical protein
MRVSLVANFVVGLMGAITGGVLFGYVLNIHIDGIGGRIIAEAIGATTRIHESLMVLSACQKYFGTYAAVAPMELLIASNNDRHPTEVAKLMGARLVTAQETTKGRRWDEAKIKNPAATNSPPDLCGRIFSTSRPSSSCSLLATTNLAFAQSMKLSDAGSSSPLHGADSRART